jgi:hypothetical protein
LTIHAAALPYREFVGGLEGEASGFATAQPRLARVGLDRLRRVGSIIAPGAPPIAELGHARSSST